MDRLYNFPLSFALILILAALPAVAQNSSESPEHISSVLKKDKDKGLQMYKQADREIQKTVLNNLLQRHREGGWQARTQTSSLLTAVGKDTPQLAVKQLEQALKDARDKDQTAFQLEIIHLLGSLGPAAGNVAPELARAVSEGTPGVRHAAVLALQQIGTADAETLNALAKATLADDALLRWFAIRALLSAGKGAALGTALAETLQSPDPLVRLKALKGLRELDKADQPSSRPIVKILKQEKVSAKTLTATCAVLKNMGTDASEAVPFLVEAAKGTNKEILKAVDSTLARIKKDNQPPQSQDLVTACREGGATRINFPVRDKDDTAPALKVEPVKGPDHGSLKRRDNLSMSYYAEPGFTGRDQFTWLVKDRNAASKTAKVTVDIKPDTTAPKLLTVLSRRSPKEIRLIFDEPVDKAIAQAPEEYFTIKPAVDIRKTSFQHRGTVVILHTKQDLNGETYHLSITNLHDRSAAANAMDPVQDRAFGHHKLSRESLILLARANGNAEDTSGNKHNGTLEDGVTYARDGVPAECFDFAGASGNMKNAVNFGDIDALDQPKAFSIAFWFKRTKDLKATSNHGISNIMVSQGSDNNNDNLEVGSRGSELQVYMHTAGNNTTLSHDAGVQDNKWHHFALTYDAGRDAEAHLFLDGELQKKWENWGGNLVGTGPSPFTAGNTFHVETPFTGRLDDLYVFQRSLDNKEIKALAGTP